MWIICQQMIHTKYQVLFCYFKARAKFEIPVCCKFLEALLGLVSAHWVGADKRPSNYQVFVHLDEI